MAQKEGRIDWRRIGHYACTRSPIFDKMPHVGLGPETLGHESQTIPQLTKWTGGNRPPIFTDAKKNGGPARRARGGGLKMETFVNGNGNGKFHISRSPFSFCESVLFPLPFSFAPFPRTHRGGPRFR